ncbi:MAG: NAD(P)-dependent oxidoreductase [Candidatus Poribacteria bacterium]|nr:NAD(P)-dependent oxidoreductase [Candidatus Poribacteria bacterium]
MKTLQENRIAVVGLDVFEKEPIDPDNPLLKMDNVALTPHTSSDSDVVGERITAAVREELTRLCSGRWAEHVMNRSVTPKVNLVK